MNNHTSAALFLSSLFLSVIFAPLALANSNVTAIKPKDEIFLNSIKTCSVPSTGDFVKLGDAYSSENNFYCGGAAYTKAIQNKTSLSKISPSGLLNIAYRLIATDNNYLALKLLNKNILESSLAAADKQLYNLSLAQAYYQIRKYDTSVEYADKIIATTSINSFRGYKARQIKFSANLAMGKPETDVTLADLQSNNPPKLDIFMVKMALIHNGNFVQSTPPSEEEFFAEYVPKNHLVFRPYYLTLLAQRYNSQSLFDYSEKLLKEAIQIDPNYLPAYLEYGRIYQHKGEYSTALLYHQKALEIDSHYYAANNLAGYMMYEAVQAGQKNKSNYAAALTYLNASIKMAPEYARAYNTIGVIYAAKNKHKVAIKYFLKALSYEKYSKPYMNLGLSYKALMDSDKAAESIKNGESAQRIGQMESVIP